MPCNLAIRRKLTVSRRRAISRIRNVEWLPGTALEAMLVLARSYDPNNAVAAGALDIWGAAAARAPIGPRAITGMPAGASGVRGMRNAECAHSVSPTHHVQAGSGAARFSSIDRQPCQRRCAARPICRNRREMGTRLGVRRNVVDLATRAIDLYAHRAARAHLFRLRHDAVVWRIVGAWLHGV